ncbi:MAG: hypothetical protein KHY22_04185 [Sutterella wadsworthensis]|jgi:hypothetical protein|nr:hypothetical protein [Sutterella wadsworthensis]DAW86038.1 MAG TPA: helix-turn-helix domain protein [Caudoviricetes sp.]
MNNKLSPPISRFLINSLGGTKHIAEIFDLTLPAVSYWKKHGIPRQYVLYLSEKFRANPVFKRDDVIAFVKSKG